MTLTSTTAGTDPAETGDLTLDLLGPSFGAEVVGLDLRRATDAQIAAIGAALVDRKVLFFRGQDLTDDDQVELARRLGSPTAAHPVVAGLDDAHPEIYNIDSADPAFSFSDVWHTDVTFMESPPAASILRAIQLPPSGGDTSWADSQLAYESLAAPVRAMIDQLDAVHDGDREWGMHLRRGRGGEGNLWDGKRVTELLPVAHPVVRVHPVTGRKGLFVNPGFTSHVVGVSEHESRGILDLLYAHLTKPEHTIRHRWQAGDVGLWDNRSTSHYANRDYTDVRVMRRITLAGDKPVGPRKP
ncbi:TauD/TfdA dioxygenase family protein [Microlunatus antarcticus]|uniref:Taurine dioxygenase n=1 Tax=Microlunatus antarcticus TaxID=53388 RepID=A0A7W5P7V3_9ACTN|nr:TauD/TfdA family dioxygenase [Microlunatus antarcticus]MBB3327935.1 taurine dioxygenase [Microlunatus antarcticus]